MYNKDEYIPTNYELSNSQWKVYLYMTGKSPLHFGYIIMENNVLRGYDDIGLLTDEGSLLVVRDRVDYFVNNLPLSNELVLNTKMVNKHLFVR